MGTEWFDGAGLLGLFLASFLAATVLPFSSEAVLAAACAGPWTDGTLLLTASLGNWLGGITTYGIGWLGDWSRITRWLRRRPDAGMRWQDPVRRYGSWLALLSWVPFIGDPLTLALGLFRVKPGLVLPLLLLGKVARYAVVIGVLRGW